jgi:hypothetical protein
MSLPIKHVTFNLTITNNTCPYADQVYLPIPVDNRNGTMVAFVNCSKPLNVELWGGLIPLDSVETPSEQYPLVANWSIPPRVISTQNCSFIWQIDRAGYFTLRIIDPEKSLQHPFNLTVDLSFNNIWCKTMR